MTKLQHPCIATHGRKTQYIHVKKQHLEALPQIHDLYFFHRRFSCSEGLGSGRAWGPTGPKPPRRVFPRFLPSCAGSASPRCACQSGRCAQARPQSGLMSSRSSATLPTTGAGRTRATTAAGTCCRCRRRRAATPSGTLRWTPGASRSPPPQRACSVFFSRGRDGLHPSKFSISASVRHARVRVFCTSQVSEVGKSYVCRSDGSVRLSQREVA